MLIRATYGDGKGGTGVNAAAVRLYVDTANKTKPADVGRYGLHLQLKNVANGKHTYKIVIRDFAGNEREVTRSFTVAVPIATPTPTFNPLPTATPTTTFPPPTYHPSTTTPTPSTTLYPTPTTSASPYYADPDAHDERVADRRRAHQLGVAGGRCGRLGRRWR